LRRGAGFAAQARRWWRDRLSLLVFGAVLMTVHGVVVSQYTIRFQPFVPLVTYELYAGVDQPVPVPIRNSIS
jgi:hypothetical protein